MTGASTETSSAISARGARRALIVGGGVMGVGIVHAFLLNGWNVCVVDSTGELAERAESRVVSLLDDGVARGKITGAAVIEMLARLSHRETVHEERDCFDVAVEAVPETMELKREILSKMEAGSPRLLATNTSSLSIDALASELRRPENFLGLHFFNPVWAMGLVEVVVGGTTSSTTEQYALSIVEELGKHPIVVRDAPGFATTRLGVAIGLEAMRMFEQGVASASDIDLAMELGYKHPIGPLRLTDLVGLDVRLAIARNLEAVLGPRFEPPQVLIDLVAAGHLGKKTGRGFYEWSGDRPSPVR